MAVTGYLGSCHCRKFSCQPTAFTKKERERPVAISLEPAKEVQKRDWGTVTRGCIMYKQNSRRLACICHPLSCNLWTMDSSGRTHGHARNREDRWDAN